MSAMATAHPSSPHQRIRVAGTRGHNNALSVYVAALLGYVMLLPAQLNLNIAGSAMPPYRFILIPAALYVFWQFLRGRIRFAWPDLAIIAATAWICLAMFITSSTEEAITASVAHIVDIALAYFFARGAFKTLRDLRMFLLLMLPGIFTFGVILLLEAITHTHIIQRAFSAVTGRSVEYNSAPRFGLMRAQGSFPHPILAGIFFTSFFPLYWLSGLKVWPRLAGSLGAICSFATVSSATLLGLTASFGLLGYNWLTKKITFVTWSIFVFLAGMFTFVAETATGSGTFGLFVRFASLNSVSAYNRILIWRYGTDNVAANPWFGIGYADWQRPVWMSSSMDNYWLIMAVRFGAPASILIGVATVLAIIMMMRKTLTANPVDAELQKGVIISIAVFALGMISVSLWLAAHVWYFVLLGLTVSLAQANVQSARRA